MTFMAPIYVYVLQKSVSCDKRMRLTFCKKRHIAGIDAWLSISEILMYYLLLFPFVAVSLILIFLG